MPKKKVETDANPEVGKKLVENLVELQKVHVNLIEKFDKLSKQISELLALFETAAKSFSQNPMNKVSEKDKDFLDKIDRLLEQNKTIAKGLMLMEERHREKIYTGPTTTQLDEHEEISQPERVIPSGTKPLPRF